MGVALVELGRDISGSGSMSATVVSKRGIFKKLAIFVAIAIVGFLGLAAFLGSRLPHPYAVPDRARHAGSSQRDTHTLSPGVEVASSSAPPVIKHGGYKPMALADFILDRNSLVGRKVRLTGLYQQMEDVTILAAAQDDMNPVDLDISRLPRTERSELLDCPDRDCTFQVEGTVRRRPDGIRVVADHVQEVSEN